jgi:hypothetical protein
MSGVLQSPGEMGCEFNFVFDDKDSHMRALCRGPDAGSPLPPGHSLIHNHASQRFSVLLLLRGIDAVSFGVHREAVYSVLDLKVFRLSIVLRIILVKDGNGSAVTTEEGAGKARRSRCEL